MCRSIKRLFNFEPPASEISRVVERLLDSMITSSTPGDRDAEHARARRRGAERFATP